MTDRNYGLVKKPEHLTQFVDKLLAEGKPFAFDIETGYEGPLRPKVAVQHYHPDNILVGFSFTNNPDWARYVPIHHDNAPENFDKLFAARELWRLLRSGKGIAHNALFEISNLAEYFLEFLSDDHTEIPGTDGAFYDEEVREAEGIYPVFSDSMIESMLMGENKAKGLKPLSKEILGVDQAELISLFESRELKGMNDKGKMVKYNTTNLRFNPLPLDHDVVAYACEDSALSLEHSYRNYEQVKDNLIFRTELRLTPILVRMEREGMLLDWAEYERRAKDVGDFVQYMIEDLMDEFSRLTGELIDINPNSVPQVSDVLFNKLGIKTSIVSKKTGKPSTGEKAMRMIVAKHPEIKKLLNYREVRKLHGTYILKYLNEFRYDPTGRAHPSHKQEGAGTGRFSVDGVSYQQWPKPYHYELPGGHVLDLNYRNFLISPENSRIVGFDYANVELRILASLSNEIAMLEAFANGVDIHKQTASTMLKVPLDQVTDKQRSVGKTLNFAIVYGSGADNIATLITAATGELCTLEQAEGYLADYYAAFPDLKKWMDERVLEGREQHGVPFKGFASHWITTVFGRKIPIFEYESEFRNVRNKGDRNSVNGHVQGAAADYMKIGMVRVDKAIRDAEKEGLIPKGGIRMIMTIHDALEFYVHNDIPTQTVVDIIQPAVSFDVPQYLPNVKIRADWHEGYRWGSVAEVDVKDGKVGKISRKIELPNKEKHSFEADTLDELTAQIDEFWAAHATTELDAKVVEEVQFEYDPEEDEFYVPSNTSYIDEMLDAVESAAACEVRVLPVLEESSTSPYDNTPEETAYENSILEKYGLTREEFEEAWNGDDTPSENVKLAAAEIEEGMPPWYHNPDDSPMALQEPEQEQPVKLELTITSMPTTVSFPKFQAYLKEHPGIDELKLIMPQGEATFENVSLSPTAEVDFQLIFGEATLRAARDAELVGNLAEGLSL